MRRVYLDRFNLQREKDYTRVQPELSDTRLFSDFTGTKGWQCSKSQFFNKL